MCTGGGGGGGSIESISDEELASYQAPTGVVAGYDEEGNPMYEYGENHTSDQQAYDQAQAEIGRRQVIKDQQAAIAAERQAAVEEQQRQMEELQRQQQAEVVRQEGLTKQFETDRAAQQLQIAGTRAASQSVAQSLQILSKQNTKQAPTAAVGKRKGQLTGAGAATAGLRMGSTSSGSGAGPNIAL